MSELKAQVREMEDKLKEADERHKMAEEEREGLRRELREMEGVVQSNQEEMASLHEQLTEVCVCTFNTCTIV